jgi:hypothetical protein
MGYSLTGTLIKPIVKLPVQIVLLGTGALGVAFGLVSCLVTVSVLSFFPKVI